MITPAAVLNEWRMNSLLSINLGDSELESCSPGKDLSLNLLAISHLVLLPLVGVIWGDVFSTTMLYNDNIGQYILQVNNAHDNQSQHDHAEIE